MKYSVICEALPGETKCGDVFFIDRFDKTAIFAVIDGLGHGVNAFEAASKCKNIIDVNKEKCVKDIIMCCHQGLKGTRGVVAAIVKIDEDSGLFDFGGVGNIGFYAKTKKPVKPISFSGVLGHNLRKFMSFRFNIYKEDIFVLFSDGISCRFDLEDNLGKDVEIVAKEIFTKQRKLNDDATILVVRY
ncbi:SpoIIE family protein phosphatase [candidate division WOR-3 bacterium]|nr:SpoIIE family protein phosphatase [candidate division WOR-3 bacterium]